MKFSPFYREGIPYSNLFQFLSKSQKKSYIQKNEKKIDFFFESEVWEKSSHGFTFRDRAF